MRFRSIVAAASVAFCGAASAVGPYDGIYNLAGTKEYLSVHQSGGSLIVGYFATIPASNIFFLLGDGQHFPPTRVDYWDLYSGAISGNSATVNGEIAYGACLSTVGVVFSGTAVRVTQQFISTTSLGFAQGINCPGFQQYLVNVRGLSQTWVRLF